MKRLACLLLSLVLLSCSTGCLPLLYWLLDEESPQDESYATAEAAASRPGDEAAYTILVYLNGSDLESEDGSASQDLREMVAAAYNRQDINIVIQTGGAYRWHYTGVPGDKLGRYLVADGGLAPLEELPLASMAEPATLTDFIDYGYDNFPAQRYGLILWNHGGGSVYGFGDDEWFDNDGLFLCDMGEALANSRAAAEPLEFIGFDACLMATLETAETFAPFARYLVASQETEPLYGWDYTYWLESLGTAPSQDGAALGRAMVDSYVAYYNRNDMAEAAITLSLVDLAAVGDVTAALEALVETVSVSGHSFSAIAQCRSEMREFGQSADDGYDMVDLGSLAAQMAALCPAEANALTAALDEAVLHSGQGRYMDYASGLSLYFPFREQADFLVMLDVYRTTGFSPVYLDFTGSFVGALTGETIADMDLHGAVPSFTDDGFAIQLTGEEAANVDSISFRAWQQVEGDTYRQVLQYSDLTLSESGAVQARYDGSVAAVGGQAASLYEIERGDGFARYSCPAKLNGVDVNLLLLFTDGAAAGSVVGAEPLFAGGGMAARTALEINPGDTLQLMHYTRSFSGGVPAAGGSWQDGDAFTVDGAGLSAEWVPAPAGGYLYGFSIRDLQGNRYDTNYLPLERTGEGGLAPAA